MSRIVRPDTAFSKAKEVKPKSKGLPPVSAKRQAHRKTPEWQEELDFMAQVKRMPCYCCFILGRKQNSPTEAHHFKSGRYGSAKESGKKTMPLCHSHHNKLRPYAGDEDIQGYHNGQTTWEAQFGPDYAAESWVKAQMKQLDDTVDF